ncbi:hypothetical protein NIES2100_34900 [Calothrix sp. NIES-2100]|uniref:hypothetical protein n=1 Tax=Calothrix sp. NIES-2100 TaxID=1954172 RepID=UPI000B60D8D7|nr:hypothetical protein NIES2100_34900 [Calothrix sp. NIES-2100]
MANQKVTQETALTGASLDRAADVFPIIDVSEGTTGNRKMTPNELMAGVPATGSVPGSMSAADKTKLDSINVSNLVTTNTNQTITGQKTISTQNIAASGSKPSAPSAGNVLEYSTSIAGRVFPIWQTPDSREFIAQTGLARNPVVIFHPVDGTSSIGTYGQFATRVGSISHITPSDDSVPFMFNLAAASYTNTFVTPNTTNYFCNLSTNSRIYCRGSSSNGFGGFFYFTRIYLPDVSYPSTRIFLGMYSRNPSTDNKGFFDGYVTSTDTPDGNFAGFQYSAIRGDSEWQFTTKDGTTQNVTAITGATFAVQKLLDFYIYCPRAGSTISYQINNLTDSVSYTGSTSTNLPTANEFLGGGFQLRATAVNGSNIRCFRLYIE